MTDHGMKGTGMTQVLMVAVVISATARLGSAGDIGLETQPGPYYVGEPVMMQVTVEGVDSKVDVTCRLKADPPAALTVTGPRVGRSVRSFTRIINGQVSRRESIDYQFRFVIMANEKGEYEVGPFEVTTDGQSREVAGKRIRFHELESDRDMRISLSLPRESVYVGQEVPVKIRWAFAADSNEQVQYAFSNLQIRSPLFDQLPFRAAEPRTRTTLSIATAEGTVRVDAEATRQEIEGREFVVVTGTRTMLPDTPGQFSNIPVTCRTEKVTEWGKSLFGDLVPRRRAPAMSAGDPINVTVESVPQSGRPESYCGAVGRGFSIDVSANRSVVRVGDPISLNVTVRGNGNLTSVSLPPLDNNAGLSGEQFQVPTEPAAGAIDGNSKQFDVMVRVKDPDVTQIPAIAFSWFDPYEEEFVTDTSKPIALQVLETKVVSADDVISTSEGTDNGRKKSSAGAGVRENTANSMTFVGANLAITRDPSQLLSTGSGRVAPGTVATGCYGLAVVLVAGGVLVRLRANRDPETLRKKKVAREAQNQIRTAERLPAKDAAAEIARTMRRLVAEFEIEDRNELDQLIEKCDNVIYTTGTVNDRDVPEIIAAAKRFASGVTKRCSLSNQQ